MNFNFIDEEITQEAAERRAKAIFAEAEATDPTCVRVEALIVQRSQFLVERLGNPKYPENIGRIRCIGGAPKPGETFRQTLQREFKEEYDIALSDHMIGHEMVCEDDRDSGVRRFRVYLLRDAAGRPSLDDPGTALVLHDYLPPRCRLRQ